MHFRAIVRIHTPLWGNGFARRRVEDRVGDSPALRGTDWLIEYQPAAAHDIHIDAPELSAADRLAIARAALLALARASNETLRHSHAGG